jgi:hypothetical protein
MPKAQMRRYRITKWYYSRLHRYGYLRANPTMMPIRFFPTLLPLLALSLK